jgi:trehalose 6-phosphate synthase/phosphatase
MTVLRDRVLAWNVHRWADSFVQRLERAPRGAESPGWSSRAELDAAVARAAAAPHLPLLLDYDGTLVPFAPTPGLAAPDAELLDLLRRLAARPRTELHLVSGRKRATLEDWFADVRAGLHAEHALWSRDLGGEWTAAQVDTSAWREAVLAILRDFCELTPGTLIEEKTAGFAWHYRAADPEYGAAQAKELGFHLRDVLSGLPVEVLPGDKVLEVRPLGVHKGLAAAQVLSRAPAGTLALAIGDDRTDEDLFGALSDGHLTIHVGPGASRAALRLPDPRAARALLARLAVATL